MKHGNNSPERQRPESRGDTLRNGAPLRAPPPKMRELIKAPNLVRPIEPEDVYDDGPRPMSTRSNSNLSHQQQTNYYDEDYYEDKYATIRAPHQQPQQPPVRHISNTSYTSTAISGSENWETYDDNSEPEPDASDAYYAKLRAARGKRPEPEHGHGPASSAAKRIRGIPPTSAYEAGVAMVDQAGNRVISGSEWTDEDAF